MQFIPGRYVLRLGLCAVEFRTVEAGSGVLQRIPSGSVITITDQVFNDGMIGIEWRDRRFGAFAIDLRERTRSLEPLRPRVSATEARAKQ